MSILRYLPNSKQTNCHFNCQYWYPAPSLWWRTSPSRPSTRSWRWTPPPTRGTPPQAPPTANYESSPGQILSSLQTVSQSAGERGWQSARRPRRHLVPIVVPVLASQVVVTDLAAPMLAEPGHTPASQSALYPLLTDDMFPLDLLQELATFLAVFSPLVQHFQQEAASSKSLLLPLSQLMDVKSSSGSRPVADCCLADPGWWGGGRQPPLPGPLPLPHPPPGEGPGCGRPVPQWGDRDSAPGQGEGGQQQAAAARPLAGAAAQEEEAQERKADNLSPASQGQQASGQRPGGQPLCKTPSWSSRPSVWTETTGENGTWS